MSGLVVTAGGMVTAVGLDFASSCAALRARLDGFAETRFLGPGGEWLLGAAVPLPKAWIGEKRLVHLLAGAFADLRAAEPGALDDAALILCLPEETRPGRPLRDGQSLLARVAEHLSLPRASSTRLIAHGRPSGIVALERARRLLAEGRARQVVIAGIDSYLTGRAIRHYLDAERLLCAPNPEGFIPGEAAAAVLCRADGPGLRIGGLGLARDRASFRNGLDEDGLDLPLRGDGMTAAYKAAFAEAGIGHHDIGVKIGDQTGETYFFKQTSLAMLRTQRVRSDVQPIWPIAASLGNVGAAAVPVMLGWALEAARKGYAPEGRMLVEASGDDGACGAAVAA
ncbi:3-oxoacyl-ACP synthase [Jannaschia seohaensis]|uniref:3-oxoacyl-[acyl-carrier-protein] synthase-1 n=1 Tax=Jannaschia seohaensis TaxID=475081 RepID=A0A2Y9AX50_9RHOB|nr:3-oxoacyl-ACP synthase [Jannaschia seohaensis]PWJ16573.1 3-oxoacyl-[acyl-carrier-protein] synthase-1 [Jannaschia seohaensis]SSA48810.1 3-oxoacyl-[acyl-carrier-protein] synthase-1 [Jannaschia seohaensis]